MRCAIQALLATLLLFSILQVPVSCGGEEVGEEVIASPEEWLAVGPFLVGSREGVVDLLLEHGGVNEIVPKEGLEHASPSVPGGKVKWIKVKRGEDGWVEFEHDSDWEAQQDHLGWAGVITVSYAYTEFQVDKEMTALVRAERVGGFRLNGIPYRGGSYGLGFTLVPVKLKEGTNKVLLAVGGFGGKRKFKFEVLKPPAPMIILEKDVLPPDLMEGELVSEWIGIPVVNTKDEESKGKIRVGDGNYFEVVEKEVRMVPLSIQKFPIRIKQLKKVENGEEFQLPVSVECDGEEYKVLVKLRNRKEGESFRVTFISEIDNSVQKFSVLPPKEYDPNKKYALILTLHGAGVDSDGQVMAYTKKDWAFVIAPTNRRRFGFDWQDWGRLDTLEVLKKAKEMFNIDEDRVYLVGHSMGGHGTWHVGLHHPDLFAAIAPSAGWTSFHLYVPFFLRRSYLYSNPKIQEIWEMMLRQDRSPLFADNALNLPIYILQGEKDEEVPPFHPRYMYFILRNLGYSVEYEEVPEMGHWWNIKETNGTDCVDKKELMDFLRSKKRVRDPKKVVFVTTNPGVNSKIYWVEIIKQMKPYLDSRVVAEIVDEETIKLEVENVKEIRIYKEPRRIIINSQEVVVKEDDVDGVILRYQDGNFRQVPKEERRISTAGPMKRVYFSPFVIVYGTTGSEEENFWNLHLARYKAQEWWWRSNGFTMILSDKEVTPEIMERYNLVIYGNMENNLLLKRMADELPIEIKNGEVIVKREEDVLKLKGDYAVKYVYENPLNEEKLILINSATSPEAMPLLLKFTCLYSGSGLPDFMIYGSDVNWRSWGGVDAIGIFEDWKFSEEYSYFSQRFSVEKKGLLERIWDKLMRIKGGE